MAESWNGSCGEVYLGKESYDKMSLGKKITYYNNLIVIHEYYFCYIDDLNDIMGELQIKKTSAKRSTEYKRRRLNEQRQVKKRALEEVHKIGLPGCLLKENMTDEEKVAHRKYYINITRLIYSAKILFFLIERIVDMKKEKLSDFFKEKKEETRKYWAFKGAQDYEREVDDVIDEVENEIRKRRK